LNSGKSENAGRPIGTIIRNEAHFRVTVFILQGTSTTQVHKQGRDYLCLQHISKLSKIKTVTSSKN